MWRRTETVRFRDTEDRGGGLQTVPERKDREAGQ